MDFIKVPFGYILNLFYQFTGGYGWALILFALFLRLVLLPATAKSKKNTMKMSRLQPQIQFLQKKYGNDQQKMTQAMQELYKAENVSMGAGCLWSLLPLFLLFPLYSVVREPLTYMLGLDNGDRKVIYDALRSIGIVGSGNNFHQMSIAPFIGEAKELLQGKIDAQALQGISFDFLGFKLDHIPEIPFTSGWAWDWQHIGVVLMPVLSSASQIVSMLISQNMNNSLITNEKGLRDKEAAENSQTNKTSKTMLYIMPLMTLFIGFSFPAALSLYWLAGGVFTTMMDVILTKKYRKIYDAEDASRLRKALQEEEAEMERERIRAERRAANPDGITQNTSKKKLQQSKQRELEAEKAAAQKEYAMKKGIYVEEEKDEGPKALSGIPERPFCKGRAYVADRYSANATEEE